MNSFADPYLLFALLFFQNPLVVFTSNMFAIMGLRSLYSILSKAASELKYLEPAVAIVLGFIGTKMILEFCGVLVPTEISLATVATLLGGGVLASVLEQQPKDDDDDDNNTVVNEGDESGISR